MRHPSWFPGPPDDSRLESRRPFFDWYARKLESCCKHANSGEDKHYSPDARMGQAGQDDRETFYTNYQPRNAGVDGQATFLGDERRDVVNDAFRELTLPRNPNLWHSLPAAKQYEIENRQDWLELEEKMAALKLEPNMETKQQREEETKLRKQKARLMKRELRKWQKKQPY
jgi:hypothetical protein